MPTKEDLLSVLRRSPKKWLVTGAAGFIGSHLVESLLELDQHVVGLDNFETGKQENLDDVRASVTAERWGRLTWMKADIRNLQDCRHACQGVDYVLHHAAMGSVPKSIEDPIGAHEHNLTGFVNILVAARDASVRRVVYASSSAVYGNEPTMPKVEHKIGDAISIYGLTKYVNELYSAQFATHYGMELVGLRYFNVFGPRQDPNGAYAAVIPRWIEAMIQGRSVQIFGDGTTTRDFCYIKNIVQANLLSATVADKRAVNQVYNIACQDKTDLNALYELIRSRLEPCFPALKGKAPEHKDFRPGDILHSQADISRAHELLGYEPDYLLDRGMDETVRWYVQRETTRPHG